MENTLALERRTGTGSDEHSSGGSWGAVVGGAFVAASISLVMLALGAGFGLAAVSPWSNTGASSSSLGNAAICWLIAMQMISCALGGYLAGRLRIKWTAVHTDEVFFRDTANGFLVWAVGLVITVTFLVSAASTLAGGAGQRNESKDEIAATKGALVGNAYFVDVLFRSDTQSQVDGSVQAEAGRILALALLQKDPRPADVAYLSKLVAAKTGLSLSNAEARVSQVVSDARQAEDTARQATSRLLLWIFLALMIGAFSASCAATIGGKQRDHVKVI
jgi:hypothetical protein